MWISFHLKILSLSLSHLSWYQSGKQFGISHSCLHVGHSSQMHMWMMSHPKLIVSHSLWRGWKQWLRKHKIISHRFCDNGIGWLGLFISLVYVFWISGHECHYVFGQCQGSGETSWLACMCLSWQVTREPCSYLLMFAGLGVEFVRFSRKLVTIFPRSLASENIFSPIYTTSACHRATCSATARDVPQQLCTGMFWNMFCGFLLLSICLRDCFADDREEDHPDNPAVPNF